MNSKLGAIKVIAQTSKVHTGTVIFLHGSGDTGTGFKDWIKSLLTKDMSFPQLKVVIPTAPIRPYTALGGLEKLISGTEKTMELQRYTVAPFLYPDLFMKLLAVLNDGRLEQNPLISMLLLSSWIDCSFQRSHVWFDRLKISPDVPEDLPTIDSMAEELSVLVNKEVELGVPLNRIIIGGFSMGGAMAMHLAYRSLPQLRGAFALSSFLNHNSAVYEVLQTKTTQELPPLFMCHGDQDGLVSDEWGSQTASNLQKLGVDVQFHIIKEAEHELTKRELLKLMDWINEKLPPLDEVST